MKLAKKILAGLAVAFVVLQFIRPERNVSETIAGNTITSVVAVPGDVQKILQRSCYNCHSNNTDYPWYAHVQPVGWWLNSHIREAQEHLNFDEFASYPPRRRITKLEGIASEVESEAMPLPSYTLIHRDAILSAEEKLLVVGWAEGMADSLKALQSAGQHD